MASAATLQSGQPTANCRIFNILQESVKISEEHKEFLGLAAEAFRGKSYKTAIKYYITVLDSWTSKQPKHPSQLVILTKYMLCICWLESKNAKELLHSLKILKELEENFGYEYPMLYYAVGKAYFKLYRFKEADEILKKGFSVLNGDERVSEYNIPGTRTVIPESSREKLVAALVNLNEQCSSWHRPDAVCCMPDCSSYSRNEGVDKHIFFGSPTFNGMVQVSCNNPNSCIMNFHVLCWKAKKDQLCSLGKLSDKEVLTHECFTPNCENQGVRYTIKRIEIYDENAELKAYVETRPEEPSWQSKQNQPPKGAIRKQQLQQQQAPKVKAPPAESRPAPTERPVRPQSVSNNVPAHSNTSTQRGKSEEIEEEDDIHDEQALKAGIEKLQELRANNFGIKGDANWRPNLQMYGNEHMLATGKLMPDPDFRDSSDKDADVKAFLFSYFFEFISKNGPATRDVLAKKWKEVEDIHANKDAVLKPFIDLSEFLLQSVKFASIGEYICVADNLPETYELAKSDTCEILRFFMANDIDQCSNSSSVDDDAAYEAIINSEKNNNSLPYSSDAVDDKSIVQKSDELSNQPQEIDIKKDKKSIKKKATQAAAVVQKSDELSNQPQEIDTKKDKKSNKNKATQGAAVQKSDVSIGHHLCEADVLPETDGLASSNQPQEINIKNDKKSKNNKVTQAAAPNSPRASKAAKKKSSSKSTGKTPENGKTIASEIVVDSKTVEEIKPTSPNCIPAEENVPLTTTPTRQTEKRNYFPNCPASAAADKKFEPIIKKATEDRSTFLVRGLDGIPKRQEKKKFVFPPLKSSFSFEKLSEPIESKCNFMTESKSTNDLRAPGASSTDNRDINNSRELDNATIANRRFLSPRRRLEANPRKSEFEEILNTHEIFNRILHTFKDELLDYKGKTLRLETELESAKEKYAAMRVRILQKNLQCQYSSNHSKIVMKIEECRKNIEVCAGIQSTLKNLGLNMPDYEAQWTKVIQDLVIILNVHQNKFTELNDQIASTTEPEKFEDVSLQLEPLPAMPTVKLTDIIKAAFDVYRKQQMKELQRIFGPSAQSPIRAPQPEPIDNLEYWQINDDLDSNPILRGPIRGVAQQNYMQHLELTAQPNPLAQNYQLFPNFSPPEMKFSYPHPEMTQSTISSASAQQFFKSPQGCGYYEMQEIISPVHLAKSPQTTGPQSQSAASLNFVSPERSMLNTLTKSSSPIAISQTYSTLFNDTGKFLENSDDSSMTFEQMAAKLYKDSKKSIFSSYEKNVEQSTTAKSQRTNSMHDLRKISKEHEESPTTTQKASTGHEIMKNCCISNDCLELFKQLNLNKNDDSFVGPTNNGAKKKQQNFNSDCLQEPPRFEDDPQVHSQENIDLHGTDNTTGSIASVKSENIHKVNEREKDNAVVGKASNFSPKDAKIFNKSEHSMDKLMKRLRRQYTGVLELDLIKSVESVRKSHDNSLSGVPISEIIREVERYILERQDKELCGYVKRVQSSHFPPSNSTDRVPNVEAERKRQTSTSSTSSASCIKKEPHNLSSAKKQWERVVIPNDGWKKENPESDCTICLETMLPNTSCTLKCQHSFHKMCIKNWYQHNQSCPTCRVHSTIDDEYPPLPLG